MGVGRDEPEENLAWSEEEGFNFELWSDDVGTLGTAYGALTGPSDMSVARITMLIGSDGGLVLEYKGSLVVGTHPGQVLGDCEKIWGE